MRLSPATLNFTVAYEIDYQGRSTDRIKCASLEDTIQLHRVLAWTGQSSLAA